MQISRTPNGDLLIHPCPSQDGQALLQALSGIDPDVVDAVEQQQADCRAGVIGGKVSIVLLSLTAEPRPPQRSPHRG
ncbi:hypothetical protein NZK32_05850 [Cyanobium sp. FGCU-52]|nr:hypothetical protein [Cyanobium sp. FGCU52]